MTWRSAMEIHTINIVYDFCIMSAIIFIAKLLRIKIKAFQKLHIPTALIAGFIGLVFGKYGFGWIPFSSEASGYASILISVLFATLFLGNKKSMSAKTVMHNVGDTFLVNYAAETAQFAISMILGATIFGLIFPEVHKGFTLLLPAGFIGGHGTAAAIGSAFATEGWEDATSIGQTFATIGLLCGIILGVVFINIAVRKGYTRKVRSVDELGEDCHSGLLEETERPSIGQETISSMSLDSITWHLVLVLVSVGGAYLLNTALKRLLPGVSFPVYGLALIVSLFVQKILNLLKLDSYMDKKVITHIGSSATDYLVAFGVATINISVVLKFWLPILVLVVLGLLLVAFFLFVVSPRLFRNYWFERGIYIFGMSTGVMSTGVILLRIIDPNFETGVLEDFGLAWVIMTFVDLALVSLTPIFVMQGFGLTAGLVLLATVIIAIVLCAKIYGVHRDKLAKRDGE